MGLLDRLLGPRITPPTPPSRDHWCTLDVRLTEALVMPDEGSEIRVVGYVQTLGVRCADSALRTVLEGAIADGDIDWEISELRSGIDANALDRQVRKIASLDSTVWYRSGRALYPEDEAGSSS